MGAEGQQDVGAPDDSVLSLPAEALLLIFMESHGPRPFKSRVSGFRCLQFPEVKISNKWTQTPSQHLEVAAARLCGPQCWEPSGGS